MKQLLCSNALVSSVLALLLTACALSPKTYFYALKGMAADGKTAEPEYPLQGAYTYGIGPVFLPESLNQPGLVTHEAGQQVKLSLYNIWAGNLRDGVTRVLASNVSELTGAGAIWPFPWDNRDRPKRQVRVIFEQLSGPLGGKVVLKAKWALTENNGEKTLLHKRVVYSQQATATGYGPYVDALNALVSLLSRDIAHEISRLSVDSARASAL